MDNAKKMDLRKSTNIIMISFGHISDFQTDLIEQ